MLARSRTLTTGAALLTLASSTCLLAADGPASGSAPSAAAPLVTSRPSLTLDGAKRVIAAAVAQARTGAGTGVIAVVDEGGNLMALERLDNTFSAGAEVAIGKARTAVKFKKPTKFFEEVIAKGRTAMVTIDGFTPLQGGIPIMVDGQVVGGVGVSGAASAAQDEEIALAAAAAISPMDGAIGSMPQFPAQALMADPSSMSAGSVTFFPHDQVSDAFSKGAVLLNAGPYEVHASRREKAGMAEIHTAETDVIYVLDGTAEFITGGMIEGAQVTASEEIRGSGVQGGEQRRLVKGDVIVVPSGVPHWFKQVDAPFTYYVVKVRTNVTGGAR